MRVFFLLFILIPIIEMWLLIEVGSQIGALLTIFLVFLTAAVGLALLRQQGLETLLKVNQKMAHGQLPASEILEGVALAVGGALLLTPGFITDGFGFICLMPFTRRLLITAVIKRGLIRTVAQQQDGAVFTHFEHQETKNHSSENTMIEGDFRRED